jgi:hypothetical protein
MPTRRLQISIYGGDQFQLMGYTVSTYGANHNNSVCEGHHKVTSPQQRFQGLVSSGAP